MSLTCPCGILRNLHCRSLFKSKHIVEHRHVVEPGLDAVSCDGQPHVVPSARVHAARARGRLRPDVAADLLDGDIEETRQLLAETDPDACLISAKNGEGIDELEKKIAETLFEKMVPIRVKLPYSEGALIALFHDQGVVDYIENGRSDVIMEGSIPTRYLTTYQPYFLEEQEESEI